MATNFPTSLDAYAALVDGTDILEAADQNNVRDAIEALEAKVGADSSVVATSHDYLLANIMSPKAYAGGQTSTLANGLIVKFGMQNVNGNTAVDVVYSAAFPTNFMVAFATIKSATLNLNCPAYVFPKASNEKTTLQVVNGYGSALDIYWLAIGY